MDVEVVQVVVLQVESCFMNMINFYLLKGQSEFLQVKQKQLPCFKVSVCFSAHSWSSDSAIQGTRIVR